MGEKIGIITDCGLHGFKIIALNCNKKAFRESMVQSNNVYELITKKENVYMKLCELNFDMNRDNIVHIVNGCHIMPKYEENVLMEIEKYNQSHDITPFSLIAFYCKIDKN